MRQLYRIAAAQRTAGDDARIEPRIGVGAQYGLDENPQRRDRSIGFDLDGFKMRKEGRARVPRGVGAARRNIVAQKSGQGDGRQGGKFERSGEIAKAVYNAVENPAVPTDQIELVHRQHEMPNADQMRDYGVAAGLWQKSPPRVDENDREISVRGAARGISRVALMSWCVGDHKCAIGRGEITVGDVDGYALLALVLQTVDQKRKIERLAAGAKSRRIPPQCRELVFGDRVRFME